MSRDRKQEELARLLDRLCRESLCAYDAMVIGFEAGVKLGMELKREKEDAGSVSIMLQQIKLAEANKRLERAITCIEGWLGERETKGIINESRAIVKEWSGK